MLVIDDSPDVCRLLQHKLRHEELEFLSAETGPRGIEMAHAGRPALILLDLDLPGMHGLAVLRALKASEATFQTPVIVVSGRLDPALTIQAFELGAQDVIIKPFEFEEMRARMRSALRTFKLLDLLAQKAQIDGLTGLYNRAFFDERWLQEHARNHRHGYALSLAMLDIDHFKSVNDAYGHAPGDRVLAAISRLLQSESRQNDLVCRYGGEEFALIMPDTGPEAALVLCERIRCGVPALEWDFDHALRLTVSIGLAGSDQVSLLDAPSWVHVADQALYAAKREGRDRTVRVPVPQRAARSAA